MQRDLYQMYPRMLGRHADGHMATVQAVTRQHTADGDTWGPAPSTWDGDVWHRLVCSKGMRLLDARPYVHLSISIRHAQRHATKWACRGWKWTELTFWAPALVAQVLLGEWLVNWQGVDVYQGAQVAAYSLAEQLASLHGVPVQTIGTLDASQFGGTLPEQVRDALRRMATSYQVQNQKYFVGGGEKWWLSGSAPLDPGHE